MRRWIPTLVVWVWAAGLAQGQVEVEVLLSQSQFLADESMPVAVRVVNQSGQKLALGEQEDWLEFVVQSRDGLPVPERAKPAVLGVFAVESSASATKHLDLMPCYKLSTPGRYQVSARVRVAAWDKVFGSELVEFDIGRGTVIWEEEFGVPRSGGAPEVRKYVLQQANYVKRPRLYLRLTDARGLEVFRVVALGPLVSFSRPESLIDRQSNLHVLFQTGARGFSYCVVNPDGQCVKRQTYQYFRSRPSLRSQEGEVVIVGGLRRQASDDLPQVEAEAKTGEGHVPPP